MFIISIKFYKCRRERQFLDHEAYICANGTAIEGVCVTGEAIRLIVPVASKERVPVASRYGAVFAITLREGFITIAVQGDS
jgi:hypothetical protein